MERFTESFNIGKIRPNPGGWFIVTLRFSDNDDYENDYITERKNNRRNGRQKKKIPTIIRCLPDMRIQVFKLEDKKKKKDIENVLSREAFETTPIFKFRKDYFTNEGEIWGPYNQSECIRNFMQYNKLVKTTKESVETGYALAKEIETTPLRDVTIIKNAKNIKRLAKAVVDTTELKEEPPEKEIASVDKILLCNWLSGDYSGKKSRLHFMYIIAASFIAAAGLWLDSGPTVVASMLVSSMMEPIKGMATVFKSVDSIKSKPERFLFHFLTLLADNCICLLVGWLASSWAKQETWGDSATEKWQFNGTEYRYTLLELMSGKNILGNGRTVVGDDKTILLPGEMANRTKEVGLLGAIVVAFVSAFALLFADRSQNKAALVGIGISASLLPPMVNAGMLWGFINSDRIPLDYDFAYLGGISFALAWINIVIIVFVWSLGYVIRDRSNKVKPNANIPMVELTNNSMRESIPLLF